MSREKGFTLVELLVVIAIIALLMSILMPALAKVRDQAKSVLCISNLKQMASAFAMYLEDNDCMFMRGFVLPKRPEEHKRYWMEALRPYYGNQGDVRCCPKATKTGTSMGLDEYGNGGSGTFSAWGVFSGDVCGEPSTWPYAVACDYGSYSINGWLQNPEEDLAEWISPQKDYNWRHCNLKGAGNIPLLGGGKWVDCWPDHYDTPPQMDGQDWNMGDQMARICMNRHNGYVNWSFMDYSARPVGVKELWKLKWHPFMEFDYGPTPEGFDAAGDGWMKPFKDYE
jgi:prepilin-type N-terminal cleavage/methylation domain-containing protein